MTVKLPPREKPGQLLDRLLDGGYDDIAKRVIEQIAEMSPTTKRRLDELEREAKRLRESGERLSPDNPAVRAVMDALNDDAARNANLISRAAGDLQKGGIEAANEVSRTLPVSMVSAKDARDAAAVLVNWNKVSVDAIGSLINFVDDPAWAESLAKYKTVMPRMVANMALRGFLEGKNPLLVSKEIQKAAGSLPASYANSMMRTLFLQSYRQATTESYKANADILEYAVRVATLDSRTCALCVILHGTTMEIDEAVEAHYQCRCTSVVKIIGIPLSVPTGISWFESLPARRQQEMLNEGTWLAWKDGTIKLPDLVKRYDDPLFGRMIQRNGLYQLIGKAEADRYHELGRQLRALRGE